MRRRLAAPPTGLAAAGVAAALLAGCTLEVGDARGGDDGRDAEEAVAQAVAQVPAEAVTAVPGSGEVELALGASRLLHRRAPVAVVAAEGDVAGQAVAAAVAVARAAPLLVVPTASSTDEPGETTADGSGDASPTGPADDPAAAVREELSRLGTDAVLAVGDEAGAGVTGRAEGRAGDAGGLAVSVVSTSGSASEGAAGLEEVAGVTLGEPAATPAAEAVAAVAALDPDTPALPVVEADPGPAAAPTTGETAADREPLPATVAGTRAAGTVVLASGAPEWLAAVATARAAGADVVVLDEPDPRTSPEAIATLAAADGPTVALGDAFGAPDLLARRLETAATGVELPGGGQVLFPHRRFVALYGSPGVPALGSMGEQPAAQAIQRAQRQAAEYRAHSPEPVVPAFEIITTVASGVPGDDGDYSYPIEAAALRDWVDAAREAGIYVVLDLQPGRTDFLTQARQYEEYLREPHVGLALDSEWRLEPDQVHLRQIGSVPAAEVNSVAAWLAQLTAENDLPQKLLLLHQFKLSMITERETLDLTHDELAVMIHADGFGTPGQKLDTWRVLRQGAPPVWWGWKNFYDEDRPTMTPAETMAIDPPPWFVSYQ
ncbi:MAG: hypothetical protein ACFCVG_16855 [Kineosporiaceae bacterium]